MVIITCFSNLRLVCASKIKKNHIDIKHNIIIIYKNLPKYERIITYQFFNNSMTFEMYNIQHNMQ